MALLDRPTLTNGVNGNPVRAVTMLPTHQPRKNLAGSRSELMFGIWYRRFTCQLWRRAKQEGALSIRGFKGVVSLGSAWSVGSGEGRVGEKCRVRWLPGHL